MSTGTARWKMHLKKSNDDRRADTALFYDYLRGKRVIFVGPAPSLLNTGIGPEIDAYDVIVRTGGAVPIENRLFSDYGSRTDVWYVNSVFLNQMRVDKIPDAMRQGLKWACVRGLLAGERYLMGYAVNIRVFGVHVPGIKKPTIGAALVNEIVQANPAELHVTGCTFFVDGFKGAHLDGYLTPELDKREHNLMESNRTSVTELEAMGHDYHNCDLFFMRLLQEGRITMSKMTRGYLEQALVKNHMLTGQK